MERKNLIIAAIGLVALIGLGGCAAKTTSSASDNTQASPVISDSKWVDLAKALTQAGVKMYGAYWCSHCQDQKAMFGQAWQYVTYIECADPKDLSQQTQTCVAAKIEGYPTWVFPDGSRVVSPLTYNELAEKIGLTSTKQ